MEFFVRKVDATGALPKWEWSDVQDFDRMQKFSQELGFEDEIVFKL
jgi:hypothetical protein